MTIEHHWPGVGEPERSLKMIAGCAAFAYFLAMDVATIEREALSLTLAERALLADRLLQTLGLEDQERMEAWGREADRRLHAFERGEIAASDGPDAVAAIRRRLG